MSEGVTPIMNMTGNHFVVQSVNTAIAGQQPEHVTTYAVAHGSAAAAKLTKIEEIVEYLKALYR